MTDHGRASATVAGSEAEANKREASEGEMLSRALTCGHGPGVSGGRRRRRERRRRHAGEVVVHRAARVQDGERKEGRKTKKRETGEEVLSWTFRDVCGGVATKG